MNEILLLWLIAIAVTTATAEYIRQDSVSFTMGILASFALIAVNIIF